MTPLLTGGTDLQRAGYFIGQFFMLKLVFLEAVLRRWVRGFRNDRALSCLQRPFRVWR